MKYWKHILLLLVFLLLTAGCGEPEIDTSTDASMRISIEKVRQSLPDDKKKDFNEAMMIVVIGQSDIGEYDIKERMKSRLHGKTGLQIIAEAEQIQRKKN